MSQNCVERSAGTPSHFNFSKRLTDVIAMGLSFHLACYKVKMAFISLLENIGNELKMNHSSWYQRSSLRPMKV